MTHLGPRLGRVACRAAVAALGVPPAELDATAFLAALDRMLALMAPFDRRQARAALRLLDLLPLALLAGRRFAELDDRRAAAFLERLATSRRGPLRRLARVVKTLCAWCWYGVPAAWPAIGYDGPWIGRVAVEALPDPVLERREERP